MKEEVERIKKLVGIDHNRWEQPCTCDKCKNMCEVPCIGTPKDIEAIIDAGYADRLKETMWMVGYLTGPKEYSREQAFNIIREWAKEFTEKYGNYDFDGSYYDEIDEFIDKKLGTI